MMEEIIDVNAITKELSKISIGSLALDKLISGVLVLAVCLVCILLLTKLTDKALANSKRLDGALRGFIRSVVKAAMWIITGIIVADSLGIPTTSLIALVSVAGLALSLSIQNIMSNLFSGITLLMAKPFVAGDFVDIGGKSGTIKTIGMFYTVMDTVDNTVISIPNGDVTSASVINYSKEPVRRVDMRFEASYDAPTADVKAAIMDAIRADERIHTDPAPFIAISEYKSSSIEYLVRIWCKNSDYWDVHFGMNERVRECFAAHGVEMSYEHMNVHILDK